MTEEKAPVSLPRFHLEAFMWACALGGILGCVRESTLHRDGPTATLLSIGVFLLMSASGFSYLLAKRFWIFRLVDLLALIAFVAVALGAALLSNWVFGAVLLLTAIFCLWRASD